MQSRKSIILPSNVIHETSESKALAQQARDFIKLRELYPQQWIRKAAPMAYTALRRMAPVAAESMSLLRVAHILHKSYYITPEFAAMIMTIPQRSPPWVRIRNGWVDLENDIVRAPMVSSSVVGAILQHKKGYIENATVCLREQVFPETKEPYGDFGIIAMQRGTACEPMIMAKTRLVLSRNVRMVDPKADVQIEEVGLEVATSMPHMGFSVDGRVKVMNPDAQVIKEGAIEMKCRAGEEMGPYDVINPEYYDQIQHTMALKGLTEYTFVCYSASLFGFERYNFDAEAWARHLEIIDAYYWKRLWPCILLKSMGLLHVPDLLPKFTVMSSPFLDSVLVRRAIASCAFMQVAEDMLVQSANDAMNARTTKRKKLY